MSAPVSALPKALILGWSACNIHKQNDGKNVYADGGWKKPTNPYDADTREEGQWNEGWEVAEKGLPLKDPGSLANGCHAPLRLKKPFGDACILANRYQLHVMGKMWMQIWAPQAHQIGDSFTVKTGTDHIFMRDSWATIDALNYQDDDHRWECRDADGNLIWDLEWDGTHHILRIHHQSL